MSRRYWKYFFTLAVALAAVWTIYAKFRQVYYDIPSLLHEARKSLLVFLILFQALNYFGGGWLFKALSAIAGFKVRLRDTIKIGILSVVGTHLSPVLGGSLVIFYSFKKLKVSDAAISFLIPTWSFFVFLTYAFFFLAGLLLLPSLFFEVVSPGEIIIIAGASAVIIVSLFFLFRRRGKIFTVFLAKIFGLFKKAATAPALVSGFYRHIDFLRANKKQIPKLFLAALCFYAGDILTLYFSFLVFGFHPNVIVLILGYTISLMLTVLALVPALPGVMEVSLALVFVKLGFPAHGVLLATLLFRVFTYWLPLPAGFWAYWRLKHKQP
jgi:uncharacterized protein (TIRG00374 family)